MRKLTITSIIALMYTFLFSLNYPCYGQLIEVAVERDSLAERSNAAGLMSTSMSTTGEESISISPTAAQYMRYGEIPVGLSTGVPEIRIPIYTIETNCGLTLPIDISYHASGIKVNDIASTVGLGWVLNAGGIIVRGSECGIAKQNSSGTGLNNLLSYDQVTNMINKLGTENFDTKWEGISRLMSKSEKYFFNVNGETGYIVPNLEKWCYECIPQTTFRPEVGDKEIVFTDNNGNKWIYSDFPTNSPAYYSEYYLTKIRLINGEEIVFTYHGRPNKQWGGVLGLCQSALIYYNPDHYLYTNPHLYPEYSYIISQLYQYYLGGVSQPMIETTWIPYNQVCLSSVKWKNLTIEFIYQEDRQDGPPRRLERIDINSENETFKVIKFNNKDKYIGDHPNNYRMLLEGLTVNDQSYTFTYNTNKILPDRYSEKLQDDEWWGRKTYEDYWGYYNGTHYNGHLLPWGITLDQGMGHFADGYMNIRASYSEIRHCNPEYSQAGILTSITYPTGGKTIFEYENNRSESICYLIIDDYNYFTSEDRLFGGHRVKTIKNYDLNNKLTDMQTYKYSGSDFFIHKGFFIEPKYSMSLYGGSTYPEYLITTSRKGFDFGNSSPFYGNVTVYNGDSINNTGKTLYTFYKDGMTSTTGDYYNNFSPLMTTKCNYKNVDGNYRIINEVRWYYDIKRKVFQAGVRVELPRYFPTYLFNAYAYTAGMDKSLAVSSYNRSLKDPRFVYKIMAYSHKPLLSGSISFEYEEDSVLSNRTRINMTITDYKYDPDLRVLEPIKIDTKRYDGKTETIEFTYPVHHSGEFYQQMINNNMISSVISETYSNSMGAYKKTEYRYGRLSDTDPNKLVLEEEFVSDGVNSQIQCSYGDYDQYHNPRSITDANGNTTLLLWSYKGQYVVAKINASAENLNRIGQLVGSLDDLAGSNSPELWNLDILREHYETWTYEYKPHIGMTKTTDPSRRTANYIYDEYGRLFRINDGDGNVLKEYIYK